LKKESTYMMEKKAMFDLVVRSVKEIEEVHSIKRGIFGKNIKIKQNKEGIVIWLGLVIKRGVSVPQIVEKVQEKLKEEVEKTLEVPVKKIHIVVKGIKF